MAHLLCTIANLNSSYFDIGTGFSYPGYFSYLCKVPHIFNRHSKQNVYHEPTRFIVYMSSNLTEKMDFDSERIKSSNLMYAIELKHK